MVYRTAVRADGCLPLGDAARHLGFAPGALVDVIVTASGSLILRIDDTPALDVPFKPLTGGAARKALRDRRSA